MKLTLFIAIFLTALFNSIECVAFAVAGCNQICTADYRPVCALDRRLQGHKTFSNMCQLNVANCSARGSKVNLLNQLKNHYLKLLFLSLCLSVQWRVQKIILEITLHTRKIL